jgi:TPR repeat protein
VAAARLFYRRAADGGSANGAAALAASYDPVVLEQRAGLRGVRPDPEEALRWYRVAIQMGDASAATRVTALTDWLRSAASRGDEKARALLDQTSR